MIRELFRPWRDSRTWWGLVHLLLGPAAAISFSVVLTLLVASAGFLFVPFTWPIAGILLWFLFLSGRIIGHVERSRFGSLLGVYMRDPVPRLVGRTPWARFFERFKVGARWRELVYGLVSFPLGMLTSMAALAVWSGSVALLALPVYVNSLPEDSAKFGLFELTWSHQLWLTSLAGLVGLVLLAPWLTRGLIVVDVWVARRLLDRPLRDELGEKVTQLETSRMAAVDSAEAERRRIERDLHDGAQQRLVSLALTLGAARERLDSDPERGRQLVAEAHTEAKAALKELRDLVRGIHPVILEDRGLDAALSAVVARSPIPVRLTVDVARRPSPAVESTAYFIVSEALTNVARHAEATEAQVTIVRSAGKLVVEVADNGVGGADTDNGTGLTGLRNRVASHGGRLHVVSPIGGPTAVLAEIPCES